MSKSSIGLSEPIYQHILQLIMTQELLPGDRIPEAKIAADFSISRTPVRDAMRQLANDGLLEIFPNRYVQVKKYTEESILEIGVLRVALDTMTIKLAGLLGSKADFLRLAEIARECEKAYAENEVVKKQQLDCDFHFELAKISGNELLMKYHRELYLRVQYILVCYHKQNTNESCHVQQHLQIAEALLAGDVDLAHSLVIDHLTSFYNLRDKYPSNFFDL